MGGGLSRSATLLAGRCATDQQFDFTGYPEDGGIEFTATQLWRCNPVNTTLTRFTRSATRDDYGYTFRLGSMDTAQVVTCVTLLCNLR